MYPSDSWYSFRVSLTYCSGTAVAFAYIQHSIYIWRYLWSIEQYGEWEYGTKLLFYLMSSYGTSFRYWSTISVINHPSFVKSQFLKTSWYYSVGCWRWFDEGKDPCLDEFKNLNYSLMLRYIRDDRYYTKEYYKVYFRNTSSWGWGWYFFSKLISGAWGYSHMSYLPVNFSNKWNLYLDSS